MKRAWIQNILIALLALVLLGALVYFVLNPGRSISSEACRNIVVEVSSRGSSSPRFLTEQQVIDELSRRGLRLKEERATTSPRGAASSRARHTSPPTSRS